MKKIRMIWVFLLVIVLVSCKTMLPVDDAVNSGTFENGMSWSVLQNSEPGNRIFLRLAIKAGAILEDDDQKGIAHFVEHMAFNGTEHFAKNELINYFESIGMTFGPEVNAYTGFDETVYMLEIPADDPVILQKSLLVLQDWAVGLSFDPEELEKERGVVLEEWRLGRGASGRIQDKQIPFLFNGSRYASRLPIGDPEIIKTVSRERVTAFYHKWYRPELMSIVLVGDADPLKMQEAIKRTLGSIPASKSEQKRPEYTISPQKKPGVLVIRDPELPYTTVQIMEQFPSSGTKTVSDLRNQLVQDMAFSIFNNRLSEKTLVGNPLMLAAQAGSQRIAKPSQFNFLVLVPSNNNFTPAFTQLIEEMIRIEKFGVTLAELEREKQSVLDSIEQTWLEREKIHSSSRAESLVQSALYADTMISIQERYDLYNSIVPQITVKEVASVIDGWYTGRGKMLLVTAAEDTKDIPNDAALLSLWQNWQPETEVLPYTENNLDRPLFEPAVSTTAPVVGTVKSEKKVAENGIREWTLSNGARVLVYPTTFKSNEILFSAFSKGGTSLVDDTEYPSAAIASSFAQMSGLNGFTAVELQKKLAGKTVSAGTWLDESYEGLYGYSSVEDLETLFQLVNLEFTKQYFSDNAYEALFSQLTTVSQSRKNEPEEVFSDMKNNLLYGTNIRRSNLSEAFVASVNREEAEKISRARFADAGDFTFVFVGSIDEVLLKKFAETYIAVLPSLGIKEEARPLGITFPSGVKTDSLKMGIDQKSRVFISFGGKPSIGNKEYELFDSFCSLLEIRLREVIREDMSGSYGVRVSGSLSNYPLSSYQISIEFGCEPGREEALSKAVLEQIVGLENASVSDTYITKLRENYRRSHEEGLKNNKYWLGQITTLLMQGRSLDEITATEAVVSLITPAKMQEMARKYTSADNYVKAYLMPKE